jgi:hypothetical protein
MGGSRMGSRMVRAWQFSSRMGGSRTHPLYREGCANHVRAPFMVGDIGGARRWLVGNHTRAAAPPRGRESCTPASPPSIVRWPHGGLRGARQRPKCSVGASTRGPGRVHARPTRRVRLLPASRRRAASQSSHRVAVPPVQPQQPADRRADGRPARGVTKWCPI